MDALTVSRHLPEGKLIRDNIPKIAGKNETKLTVRVLTADEVPRAVLDKIVEEAIEVHSATTTDGFEKEIGDLEQVIKEFILVLKLDRKRIDEVREERLRERGGFSKRLLWEPEEEGS